MIHFYVIENFKIKPAKDSFPPGAVNKVKNPIFAFR
jgi:hypothetical protein